MTGTTDLQKQAAEWITTLDQGELVYVVGHLLTGIHAATDTPARELELRLSLRVWSSIAEAAVRQLIAAHDLDVDDSIHEPLVELVGRLTTDVAARLGRG